MPGQVNQVETELICVRKKGNCEVNNFIYTELRMGNGDRCVSFIIFKRFCAW